MSTTTVTQLIFEQKQRISQIMRNCRLKQCRHVFTKQDGLDRSYCFLGALYKELNNGKEPERGLSTDMLKFFESIGLSPTMMHNIMRKNDIDQFSFAHIADYIKDTYNL